MSKTLKIQITTLITGIMLTAAPSAQAAWSWKSLIPGMTKATTTTNKDQNAPVIEVEKDSKVDPYFSNLTEKAANGELPQFVEGEEFIRKLEMSFEKATNKSIALIAPRGAGKTALIEGYAQHLYNINSEKVIMLLDAKALMAESGDSSESMKRLNDILAYLDRNKQVILFIDEVHLLFPKDRPSDVANALKDHLARGRISIGTATTDIEWREFVEKDAAWVDRFNLLQLPDMTYNRLVAILETLRGKMEKVHGVRILTTAIEEIARQVPQNFASDSLARKAIDLMDRVMLSEKLEMQRGNIDRLKAEGHIKVLEGRLNALKQDLEIVPGDRDTLSRITEVETELTSYKEQLNSFKQLEDARRMIQEIPKLKEAIKIEKDTNKLKVLNKVLQEAEHIQKVVQVQEGAPGTINKINVLNFIQAELGIPKDILNEAPAQHFERMDRNLRSELIGQDAPVKEIVSTIKRADAGVEEARGPKYVIFLAGAAGLEKDMSADILTEVREGEGKKPIAINFNEMDAQTSKHGLFGIEAGYVDSDKGGKFDQVRRRAKATFYLNKVDTNPKILESMVGILEKGETEDSRGRKLDFRNAGFVISADWGREYSIEKFVLPRSEIETKYDLERGSLEGVSERTMDRMVMESIMRKAGAPGSFIEAVKSKIVVMNASSFEASKEIAKRLAIRREAFIKSKFGVDLKIHPEVIEAIARMGYSPLSGSRATQSSVSEMVTDLLSEIKVNDPDSFKEGSALEMKFIENNTKTGGDIQVLKNGNVLISETFQLGQHPVLKAAPKTRTNGQVGKARNPTDPKATLKDAVTKAKRTK